MTIPEYNKIFYPAHSKAVSFVSCLDNALQKCDENTRTQLDIIGWDEQTKNLLLHALYIMERQVKHTLEYEDTYWWKDEVRKLKEIQNNEDHT